MYAYLKLKTAEPRIYNSLNTFSESNAIDTLSENAENLEFF